MHGHEVPAYLAENPFLWAAQFGATIRRVTDSRFRTALASTLRATKTKEDEADARIVAASSMHAPSITKDPSGYGAGVLAAAVGLTRDLPFANEVVETDKLLNPSTTGEVIEKDIAQRLTPGVIQWVAKKTDPTIAQPHGMKEQLENTLPGMRRRISESPAGTEALRARFQRMSLDAQLEAFNRAPPREQQILQDLLEAKANGTTRR